MAGMADTRVDRCEVLAREALFPNAEQLRERQSSRSSAATATPTTAAAEEAVSEPLQISAVKNKASGARRGRHRRCRWLGRLLEGYAEALETQPLIFKCMTSAFVGGLGDVVAQTVAWALGGGASDVVWHDERAVRQTLAVAIDGFFINAPFLHFTYAVLERWLPTDESTANAAAQVLVDVFVINPAYALIFIVTTGLLEGRSVSEEIVPTIRRDYATLVLWLVAIGLSLAPLHVFLFKRFPLKWRVLIADVIDLLWTFVACFIIDSR